MSRDGGGHRAVTPYRHAWPRLAASPAPCCLASRCRHWCRRGSAALSSHPSTAASHRNAAAAVASSSRPCMSAASQRYCWSCACRLCRAHVVEPPSSCQLRHCTVRATPIGCTRLSASTGAWVFQSRRSRPAKVRTSRAHLPRSSLSFSLSPSAFRRRRVAVKASQRASTSHQFLVPVSPPLHPLADCPHLALIMARPSSNFGALLPSPRH